MLCVRLRATPHYWTEFGFFLRLWHVQLVGKFKQHAKYMHRTPLCLVHAQHTYLHMHLHTCTLTLARITPSAGPYVWEYARSLQPVYSACFPCSSFVLHLLPRAFSSLHALFRSLSFFSIEILHSGLCSSLFPSLCSCYNRGCEANAGLCFLVFIFSF